MYCYCDFETEYKIPFKYYQTNKKEFEQRQKNKPTCHVLQALKNTFLYNHCTTTFVTQAFYLVSALPLSSASLPSAFASAQFQYLSQILPTIAQYVHRGCIFAKDPRFQLFTWQRGHVKQKKSKCKLSAIFFLFLLFSLLLFRKLLLRC